jgi:hypothetical protein
MRQNQKFFKKIKIKMLLINTPKYSFLIPNHLLYADKQVDNNFNFLVNYVANLIMAKPNPIPF